MKALEVTRSGESAPFAIWAWRKVDDWFFGHGSPVTIGVFRALMCGLTFINLLMLTVSYHDWFSQNGYVSVEMDARYFEPYTDFFGVAVPRINLFGFGAGPAATAVIYFGTLLAALTSAFGLWTRLSTILLAVGIVSIHHRNGYILHGGDTLIRQCVLYLAIAPSGAAFSIDRLLAVRRSAAPILPKPVSLWPQRLLQCQVAIIYFTSTWHKWTGHHWRDGTAVWYPLHLNEFDRFPMPAFAYTKPMIMLSTYGTLFVQLALSTLVFYRPLRKFAVLGGIGLHLMIDYSMNIPLFSYLMIATYLAFYDGEEVADWWNRIRSRFKKFRDGEAAAAEGHAIQ